MKISVKVKPYKYTAGSKENVMRKGLNNAYVSFSNYGVHYTKHSAGSNKFAYVYTLEKHKQKFIHELYKTGPSKGKTKKIVKVRDKQWIMHVYKFDLELLRLAGITLHQKTRTFEIKYV